MVENSADWALEYAQPLISNGLEQLVDNVTPGLANRLAANPEAHDEHLAVLGLAALEAEKMLADAVLAARNSGRTWSQIADALGMERSAAQARFSANATAISQVGAAAIVPIPDDSTALGQTGPKLGEVRRIQFSKWGRVTDLNLLGAYGWRVSGVELTADWQGGIATAEVDDQPWEYQTTSRKKRAPEGIGWIPVEGPGAWAGAIYWRRPLNQPVRLGNPEPKVLLGLAN